MTNFQILAPEEDVVYHKGDTMGVTVQYDITYLCDTVYVQETITENYSINTASLSPDKHYLYAVGRLESGEEVKDSIPVWVVEFEVREKVFPKTAVAPLKENGDSVGIIFGVVPPEYFSQDNAPSPDSIVARVYDKDGSLVFGPDTFANHPYPVYYWKGKDNSSKANKAADPDKSPYTVKMRMYYRDDKYVEDEVDIEVIPKLEKSIILTKGVTFNSGASDDKPTSLPMYTFPLHNIEYYGLLYARVLETGNNDNDYKYYTITGQPSEVQVKEGDEIKTVSVEQWNEEIWGELELKWEKVYPYISDDENDVVSYDNRDELEGWEWQNTGQLLPGVHRYMLSIKEKETKQEAEKGKGVDMSIIAALARVIPLMDPDVVDWTESYLGVPYVLGTHPNEYGQDVEKGLHKGYEGIDCSGLACWSFIWAGEPLSSLNPSYPTDSSALVNNTDATFLHGVKEGTQHVVANSDDDVDWNGYDDADLDTNGIISAGTEMTILQHKLDLAQPGDMWFVDHDYGDDNDLGDNINHMGICVSYEEDDKDRIYWIIHASSEEDKVVKQRFNLLTEYFWNGRDGHTIFRGYRRKSQ